MRRSARSQAVADLLIGARSGLPHHSAAAKESCRSSSTVAPSFLSYKMFSADIGGLETATITVRSTIRNS